MKKFEFTLDKMMHYKDSLLEKEKGRLAEIRTRKNAVDDRIDGTLQQMADMDREKCEKASRGTNIFELQSYSFRLENARGLLKQLKVEQEALAIEVEKQLSVVMLLTQEVNGLEKLREKQLEDYNHQAQKEQDLIISEMVSSKYIKQTAQASQA